MISSPSESLNILVSRNIWLITKFEGGHPERGRFMRLGWVRTGNFDDFYFKHDAAANKYSNVNEATRYTKPALVGPNPPDTSVSDE